MVASWIPSMPVQYNGPMSGSPPVYVLTDCNKARIQSKILQSVTFQPNKPCCDVRNGYHPDSVLKTLGSSIPAKPGSYCTPEPSESEW